MDLFEHLIIQACRNHWKQIQEIASEKGNVVARLGYPVLYIDYVESQPRLVIEQQYEVKKK